MEVYQNVDKNVSNAIVYGIDNSAIDYFRNKYNILKDNIVASNSQNSSYQAIYQNIEYVNSDRYIADVKQKLYDLGTYGNDNENIYYYNQPSEANIITMEYIMANNKVRDLHNRGLIDGYSGKYINNEYDADIRYKSVMNNELHDGDRFLTYYDQDLIEITDTDKSLIRENWNRVLNLLTEDIDPTT